MAKRVNYSFGKRQKEIKRQQKKDEKAAKRRLKKEAAEAMNQSEVTGDGDEAFASVDGGPSDPDQTRNVTDDG